MRVLIIESDPVSARTASEALQARGVDAQVVGDGVEGVEAARTQPPDAIVLSVELGDKPHAGFSFCNRIKKDDALKEIPLLLVSAQASDETLDQHKKLRTRADGYLRKPFDADALLRSLEAIAPGLVEEGDPQPDGSGKTERFGWSGFAAPAAAVEDEPLFGEDAGAHDEDLDVEALLLGDAKDDAWAGPVAAAPSPAVVVPTPPPAPKPEPNGEALAELRRELEAVRAERDAAQKERDAARKERDSAQKERDAAQQERDRLAALLEEAQRALQKAEAERDELRRKTEAVGALEAKLQELQERLRARESEVRQLRDRLEQVAQVRQRTQKALQVASQLLESIEFAEDR